MTGLLSTILIVASLAVGGWTIVLLILNRPPDRPLWVALGIVELLVIAFLVDGVLQLLGTDRQLARLEFLLYLLGMVALIPLAGWWVREEKSRAAAGVLLVVLLVIPVMVVRVQQVWAGTSA